MKEWCQVLVNYRHKEDVLTAGEIRYMNADAVQFLAANGVVRIATSESVIRSTQTITFDPISAEIGLSTFN